MSNITHAINHLNDALPNIKLKLGKATLYTKNQLVGNYIGSRISLNLLHQYENVKIDRKIDRQISQSIDAYINKSDKYCKEFKINTFAYEFAVIKITKTLRLIQGEIDFDKFKSN
jgi:hypothetical protein